MFTNQKFLSAVLFFFIVGVITYFALSRFQREVSNATIISTPTPSPVGLDFSTSSFSTQPSISQQQIQNKQVQQPQPSELPLTKNKKLSQFPGILKSEVLQNKAAVIQTSKGMIALKIYPEASMAASNFILLAANGFYDGLIFHRVEDWVTQGGDPTGTGSGGPGYQFPDEPVTKEYKIGIVAMANSGPNTNGSQFFILKKDTPLPPNYTIFGEVVQGMDIVNKIIIGDFMQKVTIQNLQ